MNKVEIKQCDSPGMVLSVFTGDGKGGLKELTSPTKFLHGHVMVDDKDWGPVGSKEDVRRLVQKHIESDKLGDAECKLFEDATAAATWLPEKSEGKYHVASMEELSGGPTGVFGELLEAFADTIKTTREDESHQEEAEHRLAQYLLENYPPTLRLYKAKDGRKMGMIQMLGTEHSPVSDLTGFFSVVQSVTGEDSPLEADDFVDIHAALLKAQFEFSTGQLPEDFTEFTEVKGQDRIGMLVDANGFKIVAASKYQFLKHLTGNSGTNGRFSPNEVPFLIDAVTSSKLPTSLKGRQETVDLGDGYFAKLTYAGDKMIEATADYQAPSSVTGGRKIPIQSEEDEQASTEPVAAAGAAQEQDSSREAATS